MLGLLEGAQAGGGEASSSCFIFPDAEKIEVALIAMPDIDAEFGLVSTMNTSGMTSSIRLRLKLPGAHFDPLASIRT
jgi:hypothetical protein